MVAYKSPILRLSVGLILVTISLLLVSDLLGLAPNRTRAEIDTRKTIAETLAVRISGDMATRRLDSVVETLRALVERNDAVLSAGLRTQGGALLTSAGDHANAWELESDEKSTVTDVQEPIYEKGTRWGSVEVRFAPLEGSLLNRSGGGSFLAVILFVSVAGFLAYFMFLRRALHELDPRAVVPDRVRAALDVLTEGVVIIDKNERIVLANASFARRLEGPADALIGRRLSGLVWGNVQVDPALPTESPPWHAALRGESAEMGGQLRLRGASGEEYTFFARASPITGPDAKVRGAVVTFDDMTELERKNADLQHMLSKLERSQNEITRQNRELQLLATRDPLTSALNRRSLFEGVTQLLNDARQSGEHLSCVMVDIDHFKAINDRFGHAAGNKVIKLVAQILAENARSTDLVGRYGGEEFSSSCRDSTAIRPRG